MVHFLGSCLQEGKTSKSQLTGTARRVGMLQAHCGRQAEEANADEVKTQKWSLSHGYIIHHGDTNSHMLTSMQKSIPAFFFFSTTERKTTSKATMFITLCDSIQNRTLKESCLHFWLHSCIPKTIKTFLISMF